MGRNFDRIPNVEAMSAASSGKPWDDTLAITSCRFCVDEQVLSVDAEVREQRSRRCQWTYDLLQQRAPGKYASKTPADQAGGSPPVTMSSSSARQSCVPPWVLRAGLHRAPDLFTDRHPGGRSPLSSPAERVGVWPDVVKGSGPPSPKAGQALQLVDIPAYTTGEVRPAYTS